LPRAAIASAWGIGMRARLPEKGVAPFGDQVRVDFASRSTPREGASLFGPPKPAERPDHGAAHRWRTRIEGRRRGVHQIAFPRVADRDPDVASEPLEADSFDRAPANRFRKAASSGAASWLRTLAHSVLGSVRRAKLSIQAICPCCPSASQAARRPRSARGAAMRHASKPSARAFAFRPFRSRDRRRSGSAAWPSGVRPAAAGTRAAT